MNGLNPCGRLKDRWIGRSKGVSKKLKGVLNVEIQKVILDFKGVRTFSSEAIALLSRKGLLQTEEGKLWIAVNIPGING
jgi:hypothetical protein